MRKTKQLWLAVAAVGLAWVSPIGDGPSLKAGLVVADEGKQACPILVQPGAIPAEESAAEHLAGTLGRIAGTDVSVQRIEAGRESIPSKAILIGPGSIASKLFPEVPFDRLGDEEIIIRTKGNHLLLAGGRPRGTLYAVNRFLHRELGVRWWTPWASTIPKRSTIEIPAISFRDEPAFEYREPYWYSANDTKWAVRNYYNGKRPSISKARGGHIEYKGFVHTFYSLVPPEKHFEEHPEWYSLIDGERTAERAQLCLTNQELRDFVVRRVREWLKESPDADIVSISQNDWHGACQCEACRRIDEREGTHAGTMIDFVNHVAKRIEADFPDVLIDTLAYQYTREAPKTIRPRGNVIVRLCSIECNFRQPLNAPSNAAFARDIREWSEITDRLYIWDYTTNFSHYIQPHPNWFTLGPNVRFFARHGVDGVFEQGAYQSHGAAMAELRAWVLAQLMWDPKQDDRALIREFLRGYYGKEAAPFIERYFETLYSASNGYNLRCFTPTDVPFLDFETLAKAERLWQKAANSVAEDSEKSWRIEVARLPIRYVWLARWPQLRWASLRSDREWPLDRAYEAMAKRWLAVATDPGPPGWSKITHLNESGLKPKEFISRIADRVPEGFQFQERHLEPGPPPGLGEMSPEAALDVQAHRARLSRRWELAEVRVDAQASDGIAVWMPSSHREWAFQMPAGRLAPDAIDKRWTIHVVARFENTEKSGRAVLNAGVYDYGKEASKAHLTISMDRAAKAYRSYRIGQVRLSKQDMIYVAPAENAKSGGIWIDRLYLVRDESE